MTMLKNTSRILVASALFCLSAGVVSAQSYYDDDLYYDASKAPKKPKTEKKAPAAPSYGNGAYQAAQSGAGMTAQPSALYYYDGADYVPWDNVGQYSAADTYIPTGGSTRDVDEYNRRTPATTSVETPDSITLQEFEDMSATRNLARFDNSGVARQALSEYDNGEYNYAGGYENGYSEGYNSGYNAAVSNSSNLSISFGLGYPYGYYNGWGWPDYSWNNYYWNYYPYSWGWDPYWNWSWGWTSPSWGWGWGWGYPHYYPGYWGGGWAYYRPSAPAGHRPRGGTNYGYSNNRGSYGRDSHYGTSAGNTVRPGYRPPAYGGSSSAGGYYGGSASGRNSHFGNSGYTPAGSSSGHRYGSSSSGSYRPSGTTSGSNRGNFGAGQSQRNSNYNYNSGSNRSSGSYNPGSNRASGSFGGGRSGGGYSGGGRSGGGGGHRSR